MWFKSYETAEWNITYKCNLSCHCCNRACFAHIPHTPDMVLKDAEQFLDQVIDLNWDLKKILIIGGEPTLHKDCIEFVKMACKFGEEYHIKVDLCSNWYTEQTKRVIKEATGNYNCECATWTAAPPEGKKMHTNDAIYLSPLDLGTPRSSPCKYLEECGFSIDAMGYTPCTIGGMVASMVCPMARTKRLADLLDPEWVQWSLTELCRHCGSHQSYCESLKPPPGETYYVKDTAMSKTWMRAFKVFGINAEKRD